ncbi:cold-shock protein, partial [Acinetobacter baumannii]
VYVALQVLLCPLYEGQRVSFNIAQGQKGPTATNIIAQ